MTMNERVLRTWLSAALFIPLLASTTGSPQPASPPAMTFSGRAFAAFVNLPTLRVGPLTFSDTGELGSNGGFRSNALLTANVPNIITAEVLTASTRGANGVAESMASLADVVVLPGTGLQLTASLLRAQSRATCSGVSGTSEIVGLTFAGIAVVVTGAPNQRISIPGLATLVINEQVSSSGGGTNDITVRAIHLTVVTGDEVILSSAQSDVHGCPGPSPTPACHDFVTGGGFIAVGNSHANFGMNAGFRAGGRRGGTLQVALNYIDHSNGMRVKATSITVYTQGPTPTSRHLEGSAEVNGAPGFTYSADVADNGEPGRADTFHIALSNGYSAGGMLQGGNIQLHKPCL